MSFGRFVAAITITFPLLFKPSIVARSWATNLLSTSPVASSLFGAIASISSMKIIDGAFFSASSNILRSFFSDSPTHFETTSGPAIEMKFASLSFATAFASSVLPVPGGPYSKTPFGGSTPNLSNISGCFKGVSTISLIFETASPSPPMSS